MPTGDGASVAVPVARAVVAVGVVTGWPAALGTPTVTDATTMSDAVAIRAHLVSVRIHRRRRMVMQSQACEGQFPLFSLVRVHST